MYGNSWMVQSLLYFICSILRPLYTLPGTFNAISTLVTGLKVSSFQHSLLESFRALARIFKESVELRVAQAFLPIFALSYR